MNFLFEDFQFFSMEIILGIKNSELVTQISFS